MPPHILFLSILREVRGTKRAKRDREKELAKSEARKKEELDIAMRCKQRGQTLLSIYQEALAKLPVKESTRNYIALKIISALDDTQSESIINKYNSGGKITVKYTKQDLVLLDKEADTYIATLEVEEQEKQWLQILNTFQNANKAQQALMLERLEGKGLDDDYLFVLKMIYLKDEANNQVETTDFMIGKTKLFSTKKHT